MRYLTHPSCCRFNRHPINIRINTYLGAIRQSMEVTANDHLIVQAVLEIIEDCQSFGPLLFRINKRIHDKTITLFYDQAKVLFLEYQKEEVRIGYLRESDLTWAEELCALAQAHANLLFPEEQA